MFYIYANNESIYDPTVESFYLFEPKLKLEFGKAGSLEFTMPPTNLYFNKLRQLKTVVTVMLDDEEIFRGRVLSIETDIQNFHKVYCEGDLSYLVDSVQKGTAYIGTTHALFRKIIAAHNAMVESYKEFTVGRITIEDRSVIITGKSDGNGQSINAGNIDYKQIAIDSMADEWNNSLDYIQTCIIDYTGGYLKTRRAGNITYIDLLEKYDGTAAQEITFGDNLLDLTREVSAEELFTVLIPLGDENLTIAAVNGGSNELADSKAVAQYGRIVRTHVFSNVRSPATLLEDAKRYLATNVNVPVSITVKAVDMHLVDSSIEAIKIGTRVHLKAPIHGIVEYLTCTEIEYDLGDPSNNTYTFGNPKQTLTQRYREDWRIQNSGDGGAGGAGAAASAAEAENEKKQKELEGRVYEEFLDIDPENPDGKVSLQAFFRDYKNGKEVLEQQVGINFNAEGGEDGNVNLHSIRREVDDQGKLIQTGIAELRQDIDEKQSAMSLRVDHLVDMNDENSRKVASLELIANDHESAIRANAEKIELKAEASDIRVTDNKLESLRANLNRKFGIDVDATTGTINIGGLAQVVDDQGKTIRENQVTMTQYVDGKVSEVGLQAQYANQGVAQLTLTAKDHETRLQTTGVQVVNFGQALVEVEGRLKTAEADIVNLRAKEITTDEIAAKIGNIALLRVNTVIASAIYEGGATYDNRVVTQKKLVNNLNFIGTPSHAGNAHAHTITENADGTITLGYACEEPQSFNIKATKTYKEGVAAAEKAAKVSGINIALGSSPYTYNNRTHIYTVNVMADALGKDGESIYTKGPVGLQIPGSEAYDQGLREGAADQQAAIEAAVNNVTIRSVSRDPSRAIQHTTSSGNRYVVVPLYAVASNGKTSNLLSPLPSTAVDVQQEYDEGRASVKNISVTKVSETYNSSNGTTTISVRATAENNESSATTLFTTSTKAYEEGANLTKKDWGSWVTVNKPSYISKTDNTVSHKTTVNVKGSASAQSTTIESAQVSLVIDCTAHYEAGVTQGRSEIDIDQVYGTSIPSRPNYGPLVSEVSWTSRSSGYLYGTVGVHLNNGTTKTVYVGIKEDLSFTAGQNANTINNVAGQNYSSGTDFSANVTNAQAYYSNKMLYGTLRVTMKNSTTKTIGFGIDATKAFDDASLSKGGMTGITAQTWQDNNFNYSALIGTGSTNYANNYLYGRIKVNLKNGDSKIVQIGLHHQKVYDAYASKTGMSGVAKLDWVQGSYDYAPPLINESQTYMNGNYLYGRYQINLNNGTSKVLQVGLHRGKAYSKGLSDAAKYSSYEWSGWKSGPYGSRENDCYFKIGEVYVAVGKVFWDGQGNAPSCQ